MKRLILGVGAIILSVAYFAEPGAAQDAGDLAGTWDLTIEAPQRGGGGGGRRGGGGGGGGRRGGGLFGGGPQTLVFSVEGGAIQGTLETEQGSAELTNISLQGNQITFTLARQTQRGSFESTYTGEVDGNTMTGTFAVGQGQFTINWKATRTEN